MIEIYNKRLIHGLDCWVTAGYAEEYQRKVLALPNSIYSPESTYIDKWG